MPTTTPEEPTTTLEVSSVDVFLKMHPTNAYSRIIEWDEEGDFLLIFDGDEAQVYEVSGSFNVRVSQTIRQYIKVYNALPSTLKTPLDSIKLTWSSTHPRFIVERAKEGLPEATTTL